MNLLENSYYEFKDIDFYGRERILLNNSKEYSYIYYQINLCQDSNNILEFDSSKTPVFNYYFDDNKNKNNIQFFNIKSDIYNLYEINIKSI